MTRWRWTIPVVMASALTVGCGAQARSPEPVPLDRVECAHCGMLISSEDGAGEILAANADTRFYDDVRCLSADWAVHHESSAAFVHLHDGGWIDARSAAYARPPSARTAMGSGLVAFAMAEQARAADRSGRSLTWDEVLTLTGDER